MTAQGAILHTLYDPPNQHTMEWLGEKQ